MLLRVNNVDVANATKETVMEALQVASNIVNLRVRRKKPVGRFNVSVDLTLNKRGWSQHCMVSSRLEYTCSSFIEVG